MLSEEFKTTIIKSNNEFDFNNGNVTIEFSILKDSVLEFLNFTKNKEIKFGRWCIYSCKTCEEYHGEDYVHAEILKW